MIEGYIIIGALLSLVTVIIDMVTKKRILKVVKSLRGKTKLVLFVLLICDISISSFIYCCNVTSYVRSEDYWLVIQPILMIAKADLETLEKENTPSNYNIDKYFVKKKYKLFSYDDTYNLMYDCTRIHTEYLQSRIRMLEEELDNSNLKQETVDYVRESLANKYELALAIQSEFNPNSEFFQRVSNAMLNTEDYLKSITTIKQHKYDSLKEELKVNKEELIDTVSKVKHSSSFMNISIKLVVVSGSYYIVSFLCYAILSWFYISKKRGAEK